MVFYSKKPRTFLPTRLTDTSSVLALSAAMLVLWAYYQQMFGQQTERAALLGLITIIQWAALLLQKDICNWLKHMGQAAKPPQPFRWSRLRTNLIITGLGWLFIIVNFAQELQFDRDLVVVWMLGMVYWWFILQENEHRWTLGETPNIKLNWEVLLFILIIGLGAFSLYYRLGIAPAGMTADHAEKIFDLVRIDQGDFPIYFGANSGREPFHFYASFAASKLFGKSFMTLKHVSVLTALFILPTLYFVGREIDGNLTGLLTMGLAATSVWFMVSGRSGFRAFSSAVMAALLVGFLWRAIHIGKRQDYLLSGLILGLSQYTYTAVRLMPLLVVVAFVLVWLIHQNKRQIIANFVALLMIGLVAYLPMLVYWNHRSDIYWYRSTQMAGTSLLENIRLYLDGLYQSLAMFNLTIDPVDVNIIPGWPALGPITGVLFLIGLVVWLWRIAQNKRWTELLLPAALVIFILPSALAISAPNEMPSTRRAVIVYPVAMLFAGIGLAFILRVIYMAKPSWAIRPGLLVFCGLVFYVHISTNWNAYFGIYTQLNNSRTNAQIEVTNQILQFEHSGGSRWDAYIIYENIDIWIDPRIVSIWLDEPLLWDNVIVMNTGRDICTIGREADDPVIFLYSLFSDRGLHNGLQMCFPENYHYTYYDEVGAPMFRVFIVNNPQH